MVFGDEQSLQQHHIPGRKSKRRKQRRIVGTMLLRLRRKYESILVSASSISGTVRSVTSAVATAKPK
jgi:hypothetical protein